MSDALSSARIEPTVNPAQTPRPESSVIEVTPSGQAEVVPPAHSEPTPIVEQVPAPAQSGRFDQLSRIEDKTARIEEKYARSEARMQRVVDKVDAAMDRFSNVAQQADLAAVRGEIGLINRRLKGIPGFGALIVTAVVSAVLTAIIIVLLFKYGGGFLTPVR